MKSGSYLPGYPNPNPNPNANPNLQQRDDEERVVLAERGVETVEPEADGH